MKVITGHKGGTGYHVHVKGFEVHSSLLPEGVSAVMEGARLIQWVNDQNAEIQARPPGPLGGTLPPALHHPACRPDRGRHREQHHRRRLPLSQSKCASSRMTTSRPMPTPSGPKPRALDAALKARRPEAGVILDRFFDVPRPACPKRTARPKPWPGA